MKRGIKFFIALLVCLGVFQCVRPALADIPTLSLKDSVKVAEDALAKADIDLSNYYLFSIVFTNSSKGSYWYYTYRPNIPSVSNEVDPAATLAPGRFVARL